MSTKIKFIITAAIGSMAWAFVSLVLIGAKPYSEVKAFEVVCSTTPTRIMVAGVTGYDEVKCQNPSATALYFGGSEVETGTGFPVCADTRQCASAQIDLDANLSLYCVVALGSARIRCITGR
tara:strand:- start:921 stop:1286 length:366 start_codon:yes stop_codon:yes gene_type:complete